MSLYLPNTLTKVQLVTSAAADIEVYAAWADVTGTPQVVTPNASVLASILTATTTDIVAAPAASTVRSVKRISLQNNHASVSCVVGVQVFDGTNTVKLGDVTLLPGETYSFNGDRWAHRDSNGAEYSYPAPGPVYIKSLGADQNNLTVTPTEVAGLTLALPIGNYAFKLWVRYHSLLATTGVKFDLNFTGTVTAFVWNQYFAGLIGTASDANADQDSIVATATVPNMFSSRAKGTAGRGVTLSSDTAAADMLMMFEGMMVVTVAGSLQLWHGSEVAAQSTVKAGSMLVAFKG